MSNNEDWWSYDLIINYCVCVVDADILLLLLFLPFFLLPFLPSFFFRFFSFFFPLLIALFHQNLQSLLLSGYKKRNRFETLTQYADLSVVSFRARACLFGNPIFDLETHRAVSSYRVC